MRREQEAAEKAATEKAGAEMTDDEDMDLGASSLTTAIDLLVVDAWRKKPSTQLDCVMASQRIGIPDGFSKNVAIKETVYESPHL